MIVVTGPVFAPTFIDNQWVFVHRTIGTFPKLIPVPSHFYKVIYGKRKNANSHVVGAFLVPNLDTVNKTVRMLFFYNFDFLDIDYIIHSSNIKQEPIMNFLVRLNQLEALVGFRFFPHLLDENSAIS